MALIRCVTEMGMGVDVRGRDYTSAAKRDVYAAIHPSSLGFQRLIGKTADDMVAEVTIGVPKPEAVDTDEVLTVLPHGRGSCKAVLGGLEVPNDEGTDATVIANAIVVVRYADGK